MADLLYINGEAVDLSVSTTIAQSFQVNDLSELKDRQGNYTNQFKLPKTDRNCRILGFSNVLNVQSTVPYSALEASIISDGVETLYGGLAYVQSVGDSFEVTIYGGNSKFFTDIDGKKLSDLDLSSYDHLWDETLTDRYGFGVTPSLIIVDDSSLPANNRLVDLKKQYPVAFIKDLFREIHEQAGYTVEGEILDDEFFGSCFLPFTNEKPLTSQADRDESYSKTIVSAASQSVVDGQRLPFDLDQSDTGSHYDTTAYQYFCPVTGKYKLDGRAIMRLGGSLPPIYLQIKKNGVFVQNVFAGYSVGSYQIIDMAGVEVTCDAGDILTVHIQWMSGASADFYADGSSFSRSDLISYLVFSLSDELIFGGNWNQSVNLPDITQKDFLKTIMQQYALTTQVDVLEKSVRYVGFEEIVSAKGEAKDWSDYLAQDVKDVPIYFHPSGYGQKNYFRYKKDDNVTDQLGDGYFEIPDQTLQAIKEVVTIPFAASDDNEKLNGLRIAIVNRSLKPEPRMLWRDVSETSQDGLGDIQFQVDGITVATKTTICRGQFATPEQINFGSFADNQWGGFDRNLLSTYYTGITDTVTKYKRITPLMLLPAHEIATLDHFTPIYLQQYAEYFYINKIENYQSGKPCRVELIRL